MKPVKPVFWYQGLFLQPQHFQQFDMYFQSLFTPMNTYQQPFFWGVCSMQIQENALQNQTLTLSQCECIFQDGTWAVFPGNSVVQSRMINTDELEAGKPFKAYLGLRKWNEKKENVSILEHPDELGKAGTRYVSEKEPEELKDLHHGVAAAPVNLMHYVLKIFWEYEIDNLVEYHLLPVVEMVYDEEKITISRSYIPPMVSISGSDALQQLLETIREQISSRCRKLEEYKSPWEMQRSGFDSTYIVYLLALRSLNRYVPLLHHFTEIDDIHPWVLYGLLRQIIGELSTFTDRIDSLGRLADGTQLLPEYNHEDLRACFEESHTLIGELLSAITIGPENIIHLSRKGDYFQAQVPEESFEDRNAFFLVVRTAESQSKVLEVMKHVAKVSSVEHMPTLTGRALPGISLEYSLIPPPGLPTRPNSFFFKCERNHPQWIEIRKSQSICLYWQNAPRDTQAEIIVLRQ